MEASPSRVQLGLVGASYAAVVVMSALLIFWRYLQYLGNAQDAAASSGMWAGGDLMLEIFIGFLFLVPSVSLALVIRKSELWYTGYAKVLVGLSVTAPLAVGLTVAPVLNQWYWGEVCLFRLFAVPMVIIFLIFSRWLTRFERARRLISYALMIEGLTFAVMIGGLFLLAKGGNG